MQLPWRTILKRGIQARQYPHHPNPYFGQSLNANYFSSMPDLLRLPTPDRLVTSSVRRVPKASGKAPSHASARSRFA